MKKNLSKPILIGVLIIVVLIFSYFLILNICYDKSELNSEQIAFKIETDDLITEVPDSFQANYISFSNYLSRVYEIEDYQMPGLSVIDGEIDCEESNFDPKSSVISSDIVVNKKEINNKKYCLMYSMSGEEGSIFTQNSYTTVIDDRVYLINFVARYNNCNDYPEEGLVECRIERENFDLDFLVDEEIERIRQAELIS